MASPQIQTDYELALDRFMLAFNRLDNLLTKVIETTLRRNGRADLITACAGRGDFWLKLLVADLLKLSVCGEAITNLPIALMRDIAGHRNKVAHGHFDQNPHSGEYDIVGKGKNTNYSVENLDEQTANATAAWHALRASEAYYEFSDSPLPPE